MRRYRFLIFSFAFVLPFLFTYSLHGRQSNSRVADSLRRELKEAVNEKRLKLLDDLSWELAEIDPKEALELAEAQLALADTLQDEASQASAYGNIAGAQWTLGNFEDAIFHYQEGIAIRGRLGDRKGVANYLNNIGILYRNLGDYSRALEAYLQAQRTYEDLGVEGKEMGNALNNLGIVYKMLGQIPEAEQYYQDALEVYQKVGYKLGIGFARMNIGDLQRKNKKYGKALESLGFALEELRELESYKGLGHAFLSLSETHRDLGNMAEAVQYLDSAKQQYERIGSKADVGSVLVDQSRLSMEQGKMGESLRYATQAYELGRDIKALKVVRDAAELLSKGYHGQGLHEKAYEMQLVFQQVKDTLMSEEVSKQINNIHKSHEIERRELQIAALQKDKEIRQQQNYSLLGGLALVVLLLFVLLNRYRLKKKANEELSLMNSEILNQKEEIETQRDQIEGQRDQILEQTSQLKEASDRIQLAYGNIKDSINYASRIQVALLGNSRHFGRNLPDAFALWKPRDGISGDFYWEYRLPGNHPQYPRHHILVCADCTGHGVPGAMMTVMGNALLNEIIKVNQQGDTATILQELDRKVRLSLSQSEENGREDGMDMGIVRINPDMTDVEFAGARNSLLLLREGEVIRVRGSRASIGGRMSQGFDKKFASENISLEKNDVFYLHSDGYPDQFGENDKGKFLPKRMRKLLSEISHLPMYTQKEKLDQAFEEWKGNESQTDDVLVIGVKV